MNAMKRFALLGTALMSFLTGCGTQQEHTASSQPKAAASSGTVKEIAQTGMSMFLRLRLLSSSMIRPRLIIRLATVLVDIAE